MRFHGMDLNVLWNMGLDLKYVCTRGLVVEIWSFLSSWIFYFTEILKVDPHFSLPSQLYTLLIWYCYINFVAYTLFF